MDDKRMTQNFKMLRDENDENDENGDGFPLPIIKIIISAVALVAMIVIIIVFSVKELKHEEYLILMSKAKAFVTINNARYPLPVAFYAAYDDKNNSLSSFELQIIKYSFNKNSMSITINDKKYDVEKFELKERQYTGDSKEKLYFDNMNTSEDGKAYLICRVETEKPPSSDSADYILYMYDRTVFNPSSEVNGIPIFK